MFTKFKKIIIYSTVLALPLGLIAIVFKYLYNKHNGKDVSVNDVVSEGASLIKKVFKLLNV